MRRKPLLAVGFALVLLSCTSGSGKQALAPLAPGIPEADANPAPPAGQAFREALAQTLEMAREAAGQGDEETFLACEAAIVHYVGSQGATRLRDPEVFAALGEIWDELDRLTLKLFAEEGTETVAGPPEVPEEVAPATPEQVERASREAEEVPFDLPVKVTPEVAALIDYYLGPYRERLVAALERASRYLPFIRQELDRAQLPQDLAYLPLVESAFQPHARSRAKALGLWQFMAGTARLYQLRCDGLVDERLDPYASTRAALTHLADLYGTFEDWELALAAYNSGAGRVQRAITRARGAKDFWSLRRYLPRETRNYVPAFWAALIVAKQPQKFGLPEFPEQPPCREMVPVEGSLDLEVLAERSSLSLATLLDFNPALVRGITPPGTVYPLAVPCGQGEITRQVIAAIPQDQRIRRFYHTVRRGDTLVALSKRYGVNVATLMAANDIRDPRRLRSGQELLIPKGPGAISYAASTPQARKARAASPRNPLRYRVRPGDTLYSIAKKHGTTVEAIQARNNLNGTIIRPGDVLYLAP
ncbi:MAG: LysM peptidoglycan-binding domain-containing protein [Thermoanaerobaculaceae bacterium]